ncbi:TPA: hypothetical protein N2F56_000904 [Salmonella enterica]|nr:hypothetical protein [Salmonella enterica]HCL5080539.1 hypothetical protein [Salmonella enterica]
MKEFIARNLCWVALRIRRRNHKEDPLSESNPSLHQSDEGIKKFNDAIGKVYHLE